MKIRNYIVMIGLLLASIVPLQAENSVMTWSLSNITSSMSSWGSSALSGLSSLSTETKMLVFGGFSALTGGYFSIKAHARKDNLRDLIEASLISDNGIKKVCSQRDRYIGYEGGSIEQKAGQREFYSQKALEFACIASKKRQKIETDRVDNLERQIGEVYEAAKNAAHNASEKRFRDSEVKQTVENILDQIPEPFQAQEDVRPPLSLDKSDRVKAHSAYKENMGQQEHKNVRNKHSISRKKKKNIKRALQIRLLVDGNIGLFSELKRYEVLHKEYAKHSKKNKKLQRDQRKKRKKSQQLMANSNAALGEITSLDGYVFVSPHSHKDESTELSSFGAYMWQGIDAVQSSLSSVAQSSSTYLNSMLQTAAAEGSMLKVSSALLVGAEVDGVVGNTIDFTALHAAAENGHPTIVRKLLEAGADATLSYRRVNDDEIVTERGTALSLAKKSGNVQCAIAILRSNSFKDELDYLSVEKIDQLWASSFESRMDEVTWKLNVIDCVYKAIHQRLKDELGDQRITQTDKDKLQVINNNIGSLWNKIYEKKRTLYSKVAQLRQTPEELFMGMHDTWHANKTGGCTPAQCYNLLRQIGWDENDSDDAFTAKVNELNLDDEKKGVFRQIGFMVRDEAQRELFDIYIKATEKNPRLLSIEDGSVEISPEISQMLSKLSFGQKAQSLFDFYQYLDVSEEGSYVLDNLSQIARLLKN